MVKLNPVQFKAFRRVHKGLIRKYEGPFSVVHKVGKVSYRLELPAKLKIHPVFHVSLLKPYHADEEDPARGELQRAPTVVMLTSFDREIEEIVSKREVRQAGVPRHTEFFIRWKGQPESANIWEKEDDLWQFKDRIAAFKSRP